MTSDEPAQRGTAAPLAGDLEAITLHCLEKQPGRRYATALGWPKTCSLLEKQVLARPVGKVAWLPACRRTRWLLHCSS